MTKLILSQEALPQVNVSIVHIVVINLVFC